MESVRCPKPGVKDLFAAQDTGLIATLLGVAVGSLVLGFAIAWFTLRRLSPQTTKPRSPIHKQSPFIGIHVTEHQDNSPFIQQKQERHTSTPATGSPQSFLSFSKPLRPLSGSRGKQTRPDSAGSFLSPFGPAEKTKSNDLELGNVGGGVEPPKTLGPLLFSPAPPPTSITSTSSTVSTIEYPVQPRITSLPIGTEGTPDSSCHARVMSLPTLPEISVTPSGSIPWHYPTRSRSLSKVKDGQKSENKHKSSDSEYSLYDLPWTVVTPPPQDSIHLQPIGLGLDPFRKASVSADIQAKDEQSRGRLTPSPTPESVMQLYESFPSPPPAERRTRSNSETPTIRPIQPQSRLPKRPQTAPQPKFVEDLPPLRQHRSLQSLSSFPPMRPPPGIGLPTPPPTAATGSFVHRSPPNSPRRPSSAGARTATVHKVPSKSSLLNTPTSTAPSTPKTGNSFFTGRLSTGNGNRKYSLWPTLSGGPVEPDDRLSFACQGDMSPVS